MITKTFNSRFRYVKITVLTFVLLAFFLLAMFVFLIISGVKTGEFQSSDVVGLALFLYVFSSGFIAAFYVWYKKTMSIERKYIEIIKNNTAKGCEELTDVELIEFSEYVLSTVKDRKSERFKNAVGRTLYERGLIENENMLSKGQLYSGYGHAYRGPAYKINQRILYIDAAGYILESKVIPLSNIENYSFVKNPFRTLLKLRFRGNSFSENVTFYVENPKVWEKLLAERNNQ